MRTKNTLQGISAAVGILILIFDSATAVEGAKEGLTLCIQVVIVSLFPFIFLSVLLCDRLRGVSLPMFRPLCKWLGIPSGGEYLLIPAFLGGYPTGAQGVYEAYREKYITKEAAERLLVFSNNAGPSFIFGIAAAVFENIYAGWVLWLIHIAGAVTASRLFPAADEQCLTPEPRISGVSEVLRRSLAAMAQICGWVILFRILIAFSQRWFLWLLPAEGRILFIGLMEMTNGCCSLNSVRNEALQFIFCSAFLALGGLCVAMQTLSVIKTLSARYFFLGKLIQGTVSIGLSICVVNRIWFGPLVIFLFLLLYPGKNRKYTGNSGAIRV